MEMEFSYFVSLTVNNLNLITKSAWTVPFIFSHSHYSNHSSLIIYINTLFNDFTVYTGSSRQFRKSQKEIYFSFSLFSCGINIRTRRLQIWGRKIGFSQQRKRIPLKQKRKFSNRSVYILPPGNIGLSIGNFCRIFISR